MSGAEHLSGCHDTSAKAIETARGNLMNGRGVKWAPEEKRTWKKGDVKTSDALRKSARDGFWTGLFAIHFFFLCI
jgi:hypothetical protein